MEVRARSRQLGAIAAVGSTVVLASVLILLLRGRSLDVLYGLWILQNGPSAILLLWMAFLVLRRVPGHTAGRILLAMGVIQVVHVAVATVADARLVAAGVTFPLVGDHDLVSAELPPVAAVALWVMNWLWVLPPLLSILLLLVFPDGRLPGPRWRVALVLAGLAAGFLLAGTVIDGWPAAHWTIDETPAIVGVLMLAGGVCALALTAAGAVAFVVRWRRSGELRRFRVVGGAAVVFALLAVLTYPWQVIWVPTVHIAFNALIVVYALAIARYRLHDLEPVLGRGAVAAVLSALVAGVYLVVVVGAGRLVGTGVDDPVLPLVAVGLVALLIEPARRYAKRLVDRLLYRRSADRGEVLSRLTDRASGSAGAAAVDEVVDLLLRSTGASRAELLIDPGPRRIAAGAGADGEPRARAAIVYGGERFGEVRLHARAASDLVPEAAQLLHDVARLLGIVLHDERLTARLNEQLTQLHASRRRIVEVQEQARRGLERDIHDGAQARLIAVRLRVAALRADAPVSSTALDEALDAVAQGLDAAVRQLRDLARGLHPPVLEQSGLVAALRAHVRDLPVPVSVSAAGATRYPRAIEGAAYFCCLEALQNALRHAHASRIAIDLDCAREELRFTVHDDGRGFEVADATGTGLGNIDDRIAALGGRVRVRSAPGAGTRVSIAIPAQASASAR